MFALGSFVAAWAPTIGWIIAGRTIQGAGAISAAVIALAADLTRESVRTRAMAAIGMTIGATFALSLVAGPALTGVVGVPGIFVMTGLLAFAAMLVLRVAVPQPPASARPAVVGGQWLWVLTDANLLRLNYGIFALHAALMALFVQVPFMLRDGGIEAQRHWLVYLPVLIASVVLMVPAMMRADSPGRAKIIFVGAVAALSIGQLRCSRWPGTRCRSQSARWWFFHRIQPARSDVAVAHLDSSHRRASRVRRRRLFECAVSGRVCGCRRGRLAFATLWCRRGVHLCLMLTAVWLAVAFTMSAPTALEQVGP